MATAGRLGACGGAPPLVYLAHPAAADATRRREVKSRWSRMSIVSGCAAVRGLEATCARSNAHARIPYRVPAAEELPGRLAAVAATIYLIFNEGYAAGAGADLVRARLADEAIRLGRLLADLMPDEPTVLGLLALMLLPDARRAARVDDHGHPVLLPDQDRSRWDKAVINEGVELVGAGLRRTPDRPNSYVVQAAIAACHALAASYAETDWDAVISWYDVLSPCTTPRSSGSTGRWPLPNATAPPPVWPSSNRSAT